MVAKNVEFFDASLPKLWIKQRGETADGRKFVQVKIRKGDVRDVRFFPVDELQKSDGGIVIDWLADLGLPLITRGLKSGLQAALQRKLDETERPIWPTLLIDDLGWAKGVFATHYSIHGSTDRPIARVGRAEQWPRRSVDEIDRHGVKALLATYGYRNPLVKFIVSAGLVGPLLDIVAVRELPWLVLVGPTTAGKSSLLRLAKSVWGGDARGILGVLSSLSATANAAEENGVLARDTLVAYDDMRTLSANRGKRASELHDILHRATSGRERGRYGQKQREWRTVFMSASNESVSAIFRDGAIGFDGATAVRCIEIPCFNKYGAFHRVPKGIGAKRFADGMVEQASSLTGQIGDMFIQRLVVDRAKDEAALRATLKRWIAKFEKAVGAQYLGNELGRVVPKFGLVYAAGRLAQRYGVLPWSPKRILRTVVKVFNQSRAYQVESDGGDPKGRIMEFITKHGPGLPKIREGRPAKSSAKLLRGPGVCYRRKDGIVEYCFLPQQLARILGGAGSLKAAQSELVSSGLLKVEGGSKPRIRSRRRLVEGRRSRVFCIDRDAVKRLAAHASVSKG